MHLDSEQVRHAKSATTAAHLTAILVITTSNTSLVPRQKSIYLTPAALFKSLTCGLSDFEGNMVAAKAVDAAIVAALQSKLVQPDTTLSQKYRVLFSLRNIPGSAAGQAIVEGTGLKCSFKAQVRS